MNKNNRQSMAARMARGANDDVPRDQVNLVTAMTSPDSETGDSTWTTRLVLFLRVMAVLSMIKGLYHWAQITGFIGGEEGAFEAQTTQWQTATVYFAVIELVAAVGLWLATPWGAVVWLTTIVSTAVIELMFPAIYGGNLFAVLVSLILLAAYLVLAWFSARERPP
jgi:zona occludens toxin (predicted ATPase)